MKTACDENHECWQANRMSRDGQRQCDFFVKCDILQCCDGSRCLYDKCKCENQKAWPENQKDEQDKKVD